jgi:hypothetical protein
MKLTYKNKASDLSFKNEEWRNLIYQFLIPMFFETNFANQKTNFIKRKSSFILTEDPNLTYIEELELLNQTDKSVLDPKNISICNNILRDLESLAQLFIFKLDSEFKEFNKTEDHLNTEIDNEIEFLHFLEIIIVYKNKQENENNKIINVKFHEPLSNIIFEIIEHEGDFRYVFYKFVNNQLFYLDIVEIV